MMPRLIAATVAVLWFAAIVAKGCGWGPVPWAVLLFPFTLFAGGCLAMLFIQVIGWWARRSYRRQVERERQQFLQFTETGFLTGRGLGSPRRPPR